MDESTEKTKELEFFFWTNFPDEISWGELRDVNPELYADLRNAGQALVLLGKLSSKYLEG